LGPHAARPPGDTRRLVGHRFAVHPLHAGRPVPTCRSPRLGLPPLPAAPLLGGEPEAAVWLLRYRGPAAGVELALPSADAPGAPGAAARTIRRGGFRGVARPAGASRSADREASVKYELLTLAQDVSQTPRGFVGVHGGGEPGAFSEN